MESDMTEKDEDSSEVSDDVRAVVLITGRVQGVFYRATAMEVAQSLDLHGWVRNLPDGGVEAVVEGAEYSVDEFIQWCRRGPPASRVDNVEFKKFKATGEFNTFNVVNFRVRDRD